MTIEVGEPAVAAWARASRGPSQASTRCHQFGAAAVVVRALDPLITTEGELGAPGAEAVSLPPHAARTRQRAPAIDSRAPSFKKRKPTVIIVLQGCVLRQGAAAAKILVGADNRKIRKSRRFSV